MGFFKAIIRTAVEIPLAAAKDVVTLGGDGDGSALIEKYEDILDEFDE